MKRQKGEEDAWQMAIYFDWIISILYSYVQFHFGTLHTLHYKLNKANVISYKSAEWNICQTTV